jgi:hypothetical protein
MNTLLSFVRTETRGYDVEYGRKKFILIRRLRRCAQMRRDELIEKSCPASIGAAMRRTFTAFFICVHLRMKKYCPSVRTFGRLAWILKDEALEFQAWAPEVQEHASFHLRNLRIHFLSFH